MPLPPAPTITLRHDEYIRNVSKYLRESRNINEQYPTQPPSGFYAAAGLIREAVRREKPIYIACDFDADGLTSGAQMHALISSLGGTPVARTPSRANEGYGLNMRMIQEAKEMGVELLICLDFGTSNHSELKEGQALGLTTIVFDHHQPKEDIPPCNVFINPAAGGEWKEQELCTSSLVHLFGEEMFSATYPTFAAIGTVADMVPLRGYNRKIVKIGLQVLGDAPSSATPTIQLRDALGYKDKRITAGTLGFQFGPAINAAGRMGREQACLDWLCGEGEEGFAESLAALNEERKKEQRECEERAFQFLQSLPEQPAAIAYYHPDNHVGVVGLAAGNLATAYGVPAVVMGKAPGEIKGSVRGIEGYSVLGALEFCAPFLAKWGGHHAAAGLSVADKNIEAFCEHWNISWTAQWNEYGKPTPTVKVDLPLAPEQIKPPLYNAIQELAPFGIGNPTPRFQVEGRVHYIKYLKDKHTKLLLQTQAEPHAEYLEVLHWNKLIPQDLTNQRVRIAGTLNANERWGGTFNLQFFSEAYERL